MALALGLTGWWMYIDVPQTPRAVVICVIVFNAAFGYSWGPIPWLYPPEVCGFTTAMVSVLTPAIDHAVECPREGSVPLHRN